MNEYQTKAMNEYFSKIYNIVFVHNPGYIRAPWGYEPEKKHIIVEGIHKGTNTKVKIYPSGKIVELEIHFN